MPKKLTLADAIKSAQKRGGECLSTVYVNSGTKMKWQCKDKHVWETTYKNIKDGTWCVICSYINRANKHRLDGIQIANEIAKKKGGKCLSKEYFTVQSKLLWKCKYGHEWYSTLNSVKNTHSWCRKCADNTNSINFKLKDGLKIANKIAEGNNGKCLSNVYINNRTKMLWECQKKHKWFATLNDVKGQNTWCRICSYLIAAKKSNYSYILYHWKTGEEVVCVASYEKKVVEYLNKNKINFRWQPKTFIMPGGKTYRPDLYLLSTKKWIEIKGYFRDDAKEKWNWFHKEKLNSELWDEKKLKKMKIL